MRTANHEKSNLKCAGFTHGPLETRDSSFVMLASDGRPVGDRLRYSCDGRYRDLHEWLDRHFGRHAQFLSDRAVDYGLELRLHGFWI
jgi:hypothetical protein